MSAVLHSKRVVFLHEAVVLVAACVIKCHKNVTTDNQSKLVLIFPSVFVLDAEATLKGCPHWMGMRHVTEWIHSVNLSNSVLLHGLGHTGCVTGPTR